jgi:hypothetical protein
MEMRSFFSTLWQAALAVILAACLAVFPQKAQANGIDQCISDAAKQAYECGKNVAEVTVAGAGVIEKGLAFLAQYPNCVNDVVNLNWITIGISGAITTLGATGLLPTNSQAACEGGVYSVAAKPIAKGVTSLGIPGSTALQPYVEGYAVEGFKSVALGIPIPSIGAPNLAAQLECGCAIPVMGAAVMEDIRKGIQAAKGVAKNCSAMADTLYKCGKAAVMAVLTDPAGAVVSAGGWVADKVDDAYDYLTGGCKNPPVEEYFSKTFGANVSNVAYGDASTGNGTVLTDYNWWSKDLYDKCVKFFDDCNSTQKTAERQCRAMRQGVVQTDGNGWMVGRGYYQLVRARGFEYEITRALYEKAGGLHELAREQAKAKAAVIPKELMDILSGVTLSSDNVSYIVNDQVEHVDKALGIYYGGLKQTQGLPAKDQKASFKAGSVGFLMSQRAQEVGTEGNGEAPAPALPRARAQAMAQEYIDAFNPVQMAADAMEGTYAKRLRSYLTNSAQGCVAVGDVFTCVKPEAQAICVKAQGVVKPSPTCELDWKKAAQLMLKDIKQCSLDDAAKTAYKCDTVASSESCDMVMTALGQGSAKLCSLNMDKLMADNSCAKQTDKYVCDTVKAINVCEKAAEYMGNNPEKLCDINVDKAMAKIKECAASSSGAGQTAIKNYTCSTYWSQDDCKAIYLEANSKNDTNLYCKVDVVAADKAAGERSVAVLSTAANACKAQGAVVTCPRDVQQARCKKEPYLKGCLLQRTPQYDSLAKLAQQVRADLTLGLNKKAPPPRAIPAGMPAMPALATSHPRERDVPSKAQGKDIMPISFYPTDDPLFFDAVTQIPVPSYLYEVLKTYYPNLPNMSFCKGDEKTDPDGVDQLTLCAPGLSDAFKKYIEEKAKEVNDKIQTAPPGGGKGPAAMKATIVDARINPGDVAKGGNDLAMRGQIAGQGVMNVGHAAQLGQAGLAQVAGQGALQGVSQIAVPGASQGIGVQTQRNAAATSGAPAVGVAGMGLPAVPGMGAQTGAQQMGAQAGGISAQQIGMAPSMGANLPGAGGSALPAGAAPQQQAMMGQVAPPPPPSAPPPPVGGTAPAPGATTATSTAHQQLTAANCTASTAVRGIAATTPPADGAYTCPAGAAQTLCEGLVRSQPLFVKRCTQAGAR